MSELPSTRVKTSPEMVLAVAMRRGERVRNLKPAKCPAPYQAQMRPYGSHLLLLGSSARPLGVRKPAAAPVPSACVGEPPPASTPTVEAAHRQHTPPCQPPNKGVSNTSKSRQLQPRTVVGVQREAVGGEEAGCRAHAVGVRGGAAARKHADGAGGRVEEADCVAPAVRDVPAGRAEGRGWFMVGGGGCGRVQEGGWMGWQGRRSGCGCPRCLRRTCGTSGGSGLLYVSGYFFVGGGQGSGLGMCMVKA
jgi:hypothetical protein